MKAIVLTQCDKCQKVIKTENEIFYLVHKRWKCSRKHKRFTYCEPCYPKELQRHFKGD